MDRKSPLPIHVQLKAQLAHLIQTGHWGVGTRLPTIRQLGGLLGINRNTASKAFAELEREGYLSCEPGRGTFVFPRKALGGSRRVRALATAMDEATRRARQLGVRPADLAVALYARATSWGAARAPKVAVLFVECDRPRLRHLSGQLGEALPARVDSVVIEDLRRRVRRSPAFLQRYVLAVTTFFHVREVRELLAKTGVEVVGLLVEPSPKTLMRLAALPPGIKVGVTAHLRRFLKTAGLSHLRLVLSAGHDQRALRRMLKKVPVLVCSRPLSKGLRAVAARRAEILVDDRRLDPAGIEIIRHKLLERAPGLSRRRLQARLRPALADAVLPRAWALPAQPRGRSRKRRAPRQRRGWGAPPIS